MTGRAVHNLSLSDSLINSLNAQGELVQIAAKAMPKAIGLQAIDPHVDLKVEPQLRSLIIRVDQHIQDVLGKRRADKVRAVGSGVDDASFALECIILAINEQQTKEYTPLQKGDIARRSFGVVRSYAITRSLSYSQLTLVEEPVAFVVRSTEAGPTLLREYDDMPCPAFRGSPTGTPRMPAQLWSKIIEIYQACGEFSPIEEID